MKYYWVKLNGITLQVDANGIQRWIDFLLQNGHAPQIEKVEEAA